MTATMGRATLHRIVGGVSSENNGNGHPRGGGDDDFTGKSDKADLRLAFLGCEVLPPYGPCEHTAELFADLIASAWSTALEESSSHPHQQSSQPQEQKQRILVLEVYGVSGNTNSGETGVPHQVFPSEEDLAKRFDGVVLPGSFSSAYETETPWILALGGWIQSALVANEIPTLGVCFGHQLYAHSFNGGSTPTPTRSTNNDRSGGGGTAAKCPAGPQAGRKTTTLTPSGRSFLDLARKRKAVAFDKDGKDENENNQRELESNANGENHNNKNNNDDNDTIAGYCGSLDLFYTHGDMVESLPPRGVSLGGNEKVPIQASLYFSSPLHAANAETIIRNIAINRFEFEGGDKQKQDALGHSYSDDPKVIAVTFQAHPEFACLAAGETNKGGYETLRKTMQLMRDNGDLSDEDYRAAFRDADVSYKRVNEQSLDAMVAAGRLLGWFG
jgi:GMP synthase-like glutamine amidotransferase